MYPKIEYEFKSRSWYKRDTKFLFTLYVIVMLASFIIASLLDNVWYSYASIIVIVVVQYLYFYILLHKDSRNVSIKFWNIRSTIRAYIEARKKAELQILVQICKDNSINTRPKVLEALKHYQVLVPRNIIGSGVFLSLLAIIISIFAFAYGEGNVLSTERMQIMFSILLLVGILYMFFKYTSDQLLSIFGTSAFYRRIEDLLSTIYFMSLIK
jgi:uncharacterized RDD family membrane protein YckC